MLSNKGLGIMFLSLLAIFLLIRIFILFGKESKSIPTKEQRIEQKLDSIIIRVDSLNNQVIYLQKLIEDEHQF